VRDKESGPPDSLMVALRSKMETRCPMVVWNVLEISGDDILYEWWIKGCPHQHDQYEIARILDSRWNRWRVAYTVKGEKLTDEEREKWISRLKGQMKVF